MGRFEYKTINLRRGSMSLKLLFKIFAGLQLIQGVMMLFGGSMISEMNGWTHSIGITTMTEHHGAGLICIAILFWMLPMWMSDQQLKETVPAIIAIQVILAIMPVYHAAVDAIPTPPPFYVMMAVLIGLIVMFYMESKKNIIASSDEEE
tara:strand:- start:232 stop:678 length:447 start_codon:yes stop_codon:yes gene_type:complete